MLQRVAADRVMKGIPVSGDLGDIYPQFFMISAAEGDWWIPSEGVTPVAGIGGMPVLGESIDPAVDVVAGDGVKLQLDWSFLDLLGVDGEEGLEFARGSRPDYPLLGD